MFFRSKPFVKPQTTAPEPADVEPGLTGPFGDPEPTRGVYDVDPVPEYMMPRVDVEDVPISLTMQELAAQIVRNPAFDQIARRLRSDQLRIMFAAEQDDMSTREKCYRRISALDDIVGALGALGEPDAKLHPKRATRRP